MRDTEQQILMRNYVTIKKCLSKFPIATGGLGRNKHPQSHSSFGHRATPPTLGYTGCLPWLLGANL